MQRKGQPHTTETPAGVEGESDQYEKQTNETLHTHNSTKYVNIPVVACKCCVKIG